MSERQAKRRRANIKLAFIIEFYCWLDEEPPRILFVKWRKWKKSRPDMRELEKKWQKGVGARRVGK